jgi:uncharacterized protein (TIGR04255 family)
MTGPTSKLNRPPIVEAVVDIDCDLPPILEIEALEKPARDCFRVEYPDFQTRFMFEHVFEAKGDAPPRTSTRREIGGYLFKHEDGKQLVQVRAQGFSFNRLAPYSTLDDYLPEVERTWKMFVKLAAPVQVRGIRLRYINRLPIPAVEGRVELNDFLKVGPRLSDERSLALVGFLNQNSAVETKTGNEVKTILTLRKPERDIVPIIFDITAGNGESAQPEDWPQILSRLQALRDLKNRVFFDTLTEKCLQLFR